MSVAKDFSKRDDVIPDDAVNAIEQENKLLGDIRVARNPRSDDVRFFKDRRGVSAHFAWVRCPARLRLHALGQKDVEQMLQDHEVEPSREEEDSWSAI